MTKRFYAPILFLIIAVASAGWAQQSPSLDMTKPYFGQQPPVQKPELFAPNMVSTLDFETSICFDPDGSAIYFTTREAKRTAESRIVETHLSDSGWTTPQGMPFAKNFMEYQPSITPDGKTMFYASNRAVPEGIETRGNIWYVRKSGAGWGEPQYLNAPLNAVYPMYVTATDDGTLYFTAAIGSDYGICSAEPDGYSYGEVTVIEGLIDPPLFPAHPFASPDESFLIFDAKKKGREETSDLYISFRKDDGSWSKGIPLGGGVNTEDNELAPYISPDGKYFFFCRVVGSNGDIYWVDAKVVTGLR